MSNEEIYIISVWIICSFITLCGFISGNITLHKKSDDSIIQNPFIIAIMSVCFPCVWYKLYKYIRNTRRNS